jgi:ribonuclease III
VTQSAARWSREQLGHEFKDPDLLQQALSHRSHASVHNERLEFLGDAVLGLVVAEWLFAGRPDNDEGGLTRLRARLVRRETLEAVARRLDLGAHIILGTGEMRSGGHQRGAILADALEAVVAAVYLDAGLSAAAQVVHRVLADELAHLPDAAELRDPKTRLQEALQGRGIHRPAYEVIRTVGAAHAQTFTVRCVVADLGLTTEASGNSRRSAEQQAATQALEAMNRGS